MRRIVLGLVVVLLSGCSAAHEAEGPILISFADQQRARISPAVKGDTYDSVADKLAALPQDVYGGSNVFISDVVLNNGKASKGIKVLLKGSALSDGLLGSPTGASAVGMFEDKSQPNTEHKITFEDTKAGLVAEDRDLPYGSKITINVTLPAVRGGNGDVQVYVYPLDKHGQTSAVMGHNYRVLSETAEPQEIKVPGEDQ